MEKEEKERLEEEEIEQEEEEEEEEEENEEIKKDNNKKQKKKIIKITINKKKKKETSKYHINQNFEKEIFDAYKKLAKINKIIEDKNEPKETDEEEEEEEDDNDEENIESQINSTNQFCERKLRSALRICQNDPDLMLNRNIIDKLNRISLNKRMNLNYILGNIYMSLMDKEYLFDYDNKKFDLNDLVNFSNKLIQFREEIKNTRISISYDFHLKQFLLFVQDQFDLDEDQLESINFFLEENKEIDHRIKTSPKFLNLYFISCINNDLEVQPNIYEQFKIFIQNKKYILKVIENSDVKEKYDYEAYLMLGKYLAYMFYNKCFNLFVEKDENLSEDENGIGTDIKIFWDGKEKRRSNNIELINGEKFNVYFDGKIVQMRIALGDIIIPYCQKFINITNIFEIQYIIFILLSRLYSCKYEKHKKAVIPLLAKSIINMCFFENSPMKPISIFINKLLKSEKQEYSELKNLISKKIEESKNKKGFLYKPENNEEEKNIIEENLEEIINEESLFILHNDLKLGFFNQKEISAGEKFVFYEEISHNYSVLDFCFNLTDYDIKFTITDLTLNKKIYSKERIYADIETPIKFIMYFTEPRILKFEFDNSYSWFRSKTIKYKTNVFYSKYPYNINENILTEKYIQDITKIKRNKNKKNRGKKEILVNNNKMPDKLLIVKISGNNKVFNCKNVEENLQAVNYMISNKYIMIISIFIKLKEKEEEKSYFYYYSKENKEQLLESELTKENFEKYLSQVIINNNILTVVNLYIMNNTLRNLGEYSIKNILGFEPVLRTEGTLQKILFFAQNLNQSQILYYIYKQINNNEFIDVLIFINYTKYSGFMTSLFNNEEIFETLDEFNGLNKEAKIEENGKIICDGIKKLNFGKEKKVVIILGNYGDNKDDDNVLDKLKENIDKNEEMKNSNVTVIKIETEFNNEFMNNSHVFYLDE